jgi:hypothetical protein
VHLKYREKKDQEKRQGSLLLCRLSKGAGGPKKRLLPSPYIALSSSTDITKTKKFRLVVLKFFSLIEKKLCFSQQHASKIRFGARF